VVIFNVSGMCWKWNLIKDVDAEVLKIECVLVDITVKCNTVREVPETFVDKHVDTSLEMVTITVMVEALLW
jgi:hypothetical protein